MHFFFIKWVSILIVEFRHSSKLIGLSSLCISFFYLIHHFLKSLVLVELLWKDIVLLIWVLAQVLKFLSDWWSLWLIWCLLLILSLLNSNNWSWLPSRIFWLYLSIVCIHLLRRLHFSLSCYLHQLPLLTDQSFMLSIISSFSDALVIPSLR